jgi:hypothetical protein
MQAALYIVQTPCSDASYICTRNTVQLHVSQKQQQQHCAVARFQISPVGAGVQVPLVYTQLPVCLNSSSSSTSSSGTGAAKCTELLAVLIFITSKLSVIGGQC